MDHNVALTQTFLVRFLEKALRHLKHLPQKVIRAADFSCWFLKILASNQIPAKRLIIGIRIVTSPDLFSISLFVKVPHLSFRETTGSHNHNHLRLCLSDGANNWRKKQVKGVTLESLLATLLLSVIWFGLSENCLSQSNNYSFSCSESWDVGCISGWTYLVLTLLLLLSQLFFNCLVGIKFRSCHYENLLSWCLLAWKNVLIALLAVLSTSIFAIMVTPDSLVCLFFSNTLLTLAFSLN